LLLLPFNKNAVYPRWRGELIAQAGSLRCNLGLSPLARGTLHIENAAMGAIRFIPAGAGNSTEGTRMA